MESGQVITKAGIAELNRLHDYSRLDNPTVIQAFGVMRELQSWVEQASGGMSPCANLEITSTAICVRVGDVFVWYSDENGFDELTFEFCRSEFAKHVADLQAVITPDA